MRTDLFSYDLPKSFIAQHPAEPRDSSRLLVLDRVSGRIEHSRFSDVGAFLRRGDLLVANDSRVVPARLRGRKPTGGGVEIFLLRQLDEKGLEWSCLVRGRGLRAGARVELDGGPVEAEIVAEERGGLRRTRFSEPVEGMLGELGELPLPPYITEFSGDTGRYQTVYGRADGSVAAPTAGLHYTPALLQSLRGMGVGWETITLHVGLDTFGPVTAERVADHEIHREWAELTAETAEAIRGAKAQGGRVFAVGTTSTRVLEYCATTALGVDGYGLGREGMGVVPYAGEVDLFIYPGYRFRAVDALLTNFHLPRSSLLMLVSAFVGQAHPQDVDAGRQLLLRTYEEAKAEGYRFYSFGDAMLIM
ncbi:MAG: tRNA preQ1(34) S-adenosylmethionine ribosyltransferase-isomerase QueA [Caldilineaceae bacterium]|nr:tRNA preQ1(34) S-adenosylmethionine ribosyltransferase-isomerase QueA [Caldilineaceae bacterium]MDE0464582.1 tRNA preQ1(34) S-adenosylmethionine ribosyltransferase-isomerase QueA [Caldilineaceae bacterium]